LTTPSLIRDTGPRTYSAARDRQRFFFKRDLLRNGCRYRQRSFAFMCPFRVPTKRPYKIGTGTPPLGVRSPRPKIYFGGPWLFIIERNFFLDLLSDRGWGALSIAFTTIWVGIQGTKKWRSKILGAWHFFNLRYLWRHVVQSYHCIF